MGILSDSVRPSSREARSYDIDGNVDQVAEQSRVHAEAAEGSVSRAMPLNSDDVHLNVCTHGVHDCRCGDTGGAVGRAIRDELRRRKEADPSDPSTRVKLAEVAHGCSNL